jgi:hypothetical protein
MKSAWEAAACAVNAGMLRAASLFVPACRRKEWRSEWRGELWQVRSQTFGVSSWQQEREIAVFCLGAFNDALCLRRMDGHGPTENSPRTRSLPLQFFSVDSVWQCLLFLALLLGLSYGLSRVLTGVRAERSFSEAPFRSGLVLIENANNEDSPPTISSGQYQLWRQSKQEFFDGFAFYRVTKERVNLGPMNTRWGVASTSSDFFALLGLPVRFRQADASVDAELPSVILSEDLWKREFGSDPHVAGGVVRVGLRNATIAGVVPVEPWQLPGKVDAWLVEPDSQATANGSGYVVAHLSSSGKSKMSEQRIPITSYAPHRSPDDLLGIKLNRSVPGSWDVFLFAMLLAFLALPAVTSFSAGEDSVSLQTISRWRKLCRSGCLFAKIALVLPLVHFSALDLAYGFCWFNRNQALYIQLVVTFFGCLFGMSWVLSDQRRRCPVCLRRVAHPARVGQFSRTFLAWSGTELMCMGGHTLLHVPSLPTSWFGEQRWMFLDHSWDFLFAGPVVGTGIRD